MVLLCVCINKGLHEHKENRVVEIVHSTRKIHDIMLVVENDDSSVLMISELNTTILREFRRSLVAYKASGSRSNHLFIVFFQSPLGISIHVNQRLP